MIVVFTGPTLPEASVREALRGLPLPLSVRPPVAQGDVTRAVLDGATVIGMIDGFFDRVPAVWHKEILWAMSRGVHVYGAASMGALRAAELHTFGMVGVGAVFEAFRDGVLTGDDEVAVAHGAADDGWRPAGEAMVDVRYTLRTALQGGILSQGEVSGLLTVARRLFYPLRSWPTILDEAVTAGLPADRAASLRAWLPGGRRSIKREDAVALIGVLREHTEKAPGPKAVGYTFQQTTLWERSRLHAELAWKDNIGSEALADEVRLQGASEWGRLRDEALLRVLMLDEARRRGKGETLRQRVLSVRRLHRHRALGQLEGVLESQGMRDTLAARATDKASVLREAGLGDPTLELAGISEAALLTWFFTETLGRPVPGSLAGWVEDLHIDGRGQFIQLLLRERLYQQLTRTGTAAP
ncbi:MAG: hypothetical protein ACI8S6_004399 [Myxococcota bacterium]|jgi:hypothetical protein